MRASDGSLLLDGQPFKNIGANMIGGIVRLHYQAVANGCDYKSQSEIDASLDELASVGVKVIRVAFFPYWPSTFKFGVMGGKTVAAATLSDREAHYQKIDAFLASCASRGIGVIANLFFRLATVSDLVGEIRRQWLNSGSLTRAFASTLTQEVVTRYLNHSALYGWEFSNELNHHNDSTADTSTAINVQFGSASSYPAGNSNFSGSELATLLAWWFSVVRAIDNQRIVLSGNGASSFFQPGGIGGISSPIRSWYEEQVRDNPTNCASIHWYSGQGYASADDRGLSAVLSGVRHWQRYQGRAFVLGEFGNAPPSVLAISNNGSDLTLSFGGKIRATAGHVVEIQGAAPPDWNGFYTIVSVASNQLSAVAVKQDAVPGSAYSSGGKCQDLRGYFSRLLDEISTSGTDIAMLWEYDRDTFAPLFFSFHGDSLNDWMLPLIAAKNAQLASP